MVIGLMNKLERIGKIYRKTLAKLAPSMEEYGTKLALYSISCALKNVILQSGRVGVLFETRVRWSAVRLYTESWKSAETLQLSYKSQTFSFSGNFPSPLSVNRVTKCDLQHE